MSPQDIERKMERERLAWVDVAPGKRIQFLRPLMDEARLFTAEGFSMTLVCEYLRDWDGIVESDLIKTGGSDSVEFDKRVATKALCDNMGWAQTVAKAMADAMAARSAATAATEKNSPLSST